LFKQSLLVFLSENEFNEIEYLTVRDKLMASGIGLQIISDRIGICTGNNGLKVASEINLMNVKVNNFLGIIIIGGNGIRRHWMNQSLHQILKKFNCKNKLIAAICAAPVILAKAGIENFNISSCINSDKNEIIKSGIKFCEENVVNSGNIITASSEDYSDQFVDSILRFLRKEK
jgi:protease I